MRRASAAAMFPTSFPGGELLDIQLTETSTVEDLAKNLREACARASAMKSFHRRRWLWSEDNPQILAYKKAGRTGNRAENRFRADWRGTDARLFAEKGATVIMHSSTGEGMHADGEYVVWQSVRRAGTDSD